jgi:thiol-disulfide isomerase/thioredoxin
MSERKTVLEQWALAVTILALAIVGSSAAPAPRVGIDSLASLPIVVSKPYDDSADADAAVDAAFVRAHKSGRRVLIDLGGNWCIDCILLANVMLLPDMEPFVSAHFEVVYVDVGRFNRNLQIPARFGLTQRLEGVPSLLIASADGTLLNSGHTAALAEARHMTPQEIADWLARWSE